MTTSSNSSESHSAAHRRIAQNARCQWSGEISRRIDQVYPRPNTVGKAPIGYRNIGKLVEGREVRTVVIDPDRAPLVQWVFEMYATGEWTIERLLEEATARGLRTVATRKRVEKGMVLSRFHAMLRNRYYVGKISFKGVEYDGNHPHIVDLETFEAVQAILASRRCGEKERQHHHYLKAPLFALGADLGCVSPDLKSEQQLLTREIEGLELKQMAGSP